MYGFRTTATHDLIKVATCLYIHAARVNKCMWLLCTALPAIATLNILINICTASGIHMHISISRWYEFEIPGNLGNTV